MISSYPYYLRSSPKYRDRHKGGSDCVTIIRVCHRATMRPLSIYAVGARHLLILGIRKTCLGGRCFPLAAACFTYVIYD